MEIKKERKCRLFWRKRNRLKRKVGLGAVPTSGREGNIMIEKKCYQPLLPVGGVHANTQL